jgi:hypothetical protein
MNALDECAFAVGNFILNFGMLDLHVLEFLEAKLAPDKFAKVRERPLHERLEIVGELFAERPTELAAFKSLLEQVAPLRKLRNHIAHGAVLVEIDPLTGGPTIRIAETKEQHDSARFGDQALSPRMLIETSRKLVDLCEEFRRLFGLYSVGGTSTPAGANEQQTTPLS